MWPGRALQVETQRPETFIRSWSLSQQEGSHSSGRATGPGGHVHSPGCRGLSQEEISDLRGLHVCVPEVDCKEPSLSAEPERISDFERPKEGIPPEGSCPAPSKPSLPQGLSGSRQNRDQLSPAQPQQRLPRAGLGRGPARKGAVTLSSCGIIAGLTPLGPLPGDSGVLLFSPQGSQ